MNDIKYLGTAVTTLSNKYFIDSSVMSVLFTYDIIVHSNKLKVRWNIAPGFFDGECDPCMH